MKRFLALLLACMCLLSSACAQGADYTVATKLVKQLAAGSGFSGVLTLEADTQFFKTTQPLVLDIDYIFVRPESVSLGEHRADLSLMDGENVLTSAHVQVLNGETAFQADVLGADWFRFDQPSEPAEEGESALIPTLLRAAIALATVNGMDKDVDAALKRALEDAITRVDIWIEGYRQGADLDKMDDGTTTVEVEYAITPTAVKSQVKQLVFALLGDSEALAALQLALGEEMAVYLNPLYQQWYFDCIDALPLSDDLTITRIVSLEGDTLHLSLKLPLYDSELGAITLCYERTSGDADLPDEQVISMETENQLWELRYQTYSSMTGVEVIQGEFKREITADFAVADEQPEPFAYSFTLKQETLETKDEENRDVYSYNAALTLTDQKTGEETEFVLTSSFVSEERKSAATEMTATLTITSGDDAIELSFTGESRKKWDPELITSVPLDGEGLDQLMPGAIVRLVTLLSDMIIVPEGE